jgi:hypothetical protein
MWFRIQQQDTTNMHETYHCVKEINIIALKAEKLTKEPCDTSTLHRTETTGFLIMVLSAAAAGELFIFRPGFVKNKSKVKKGRKYTKYKLFSSRGML